MARENKPGFPVSVKIFSAIGQNTAGVGELGRLIRHAATVRTATRMVIRLTECCG